MYRNSTLLECLLNSFWAFAVYWTLCPLWVGFKPGGFFFASEPSFNKLHRISPSQDSAAPPADPGSFTLAVVKIYSRAMSAGFWTSTNVYYLHWAPWREWEAPLTTPQHPFLFYMVVRDRRHRKGDVVFCLPVAVMISALGQVGFQSAASLGRHLIILWLFTVWPPSTSQSLWASPTLPQISFRYIPACRFLLLGLSSRWLPVRVCVHPHSSSLVPSVPFLGPTDDSCALFLPGRGNELRSSAVHFYTPRFF